MGILHSTMKDGWTIFSEYTREAHSRINSCSVRFIGHELISDVAKSVSPTKENSFKRPMDFLPIPDMETPLSDISDLRSSELSPVEKDKDFAASKVQKVYRSYRTRRYLADCAVDVYLGELWWQTTEYIALEKSSGHAFNANKPDTATSRWLRATVKASKVGRGLSKDENASKLAFQHWLEAIDPRHRYGRNLHFYYDVWFDSDTTEPFFYWLDIGGGKCLDLKDDCPRSKLQKERINYLGPKERVRYEIIPKNGKLLYRWNGALLDTTKGSKESKWIFVMSTSKQLYAGQKKRGTFQHSSFLAGAATSSAGRFVVKEGILKKISPYSGHYHPTDQNFSVMKKYLEENGIDLTNVEIEPFAEDDSQRPHTAEKKDSNKLKGDQIVLLDTNILSSDMKVDREAAPFAALFNNPEEVSVAPAQGNGYANKNQEELLSEKPMSDTEALSRESEQQQKKAEEEVGVVKLFERCNSRKALRPYQRVKQLSLKWTSGVGPRINCIAESPKELRNMALELSNLSPRPANANGYLSPKSLIAYGIQSPRCRSPLCYHTQPVKVPY